MQSHRLVIWGLSVLVLLALLLAGGGTTSANAPGQGIAQVGTPEPTTVEGGGEEPAPTPTGLMDEVIITWTPVPTATPGVIQQEVANLNAMIITRRIFINAAAATALPAVGVGGQAVCFGGEDGSRSKDLIVMMRIG